MHPVAMMIVLIPLVLIQLAEILHAPTLDAQILVVNDLPFSFITQNRFEFLAVIEFFLLWQGPVEISKKLNGT